MPKNSELPQPVTRSSSKKDLWEELQCARAECQSQQTVVNTFRDSALKAANELNLLRYQMQAMRAVLVLQVQP